MLVLHNARVVTPDQSLRGEDGALRGAAMGRLLVHERADVVCEDGVIRAVVPAGDIGTGKDASNATHVECDGRVLCPAFVDCHTHACYINDRVDEWERRLSGVSYLEILKAGGGIHATVASVRASNHDGLLAPTLARLRAMAAHGSLTIEVKTGYGLSLDDETHMLSVIRDARIAMEREGVSIVPTLLLGHALDPALPREEFVRATIETTLPKLVELSKSCGIVRAAIDAYCEDGAWSRDECLALFAASQRLGCVLRVHADQFSCQGMVEAAVSGAVAFRTIDHLEATSADAMHALARTSTIGVALPASGFHTDGRYARLRPLIDAGGACAIASNRNPGTGPISSMAIVMALAVRHCGLSPAEALTACTANGAAALGLSMRGCIAPRQRADMLLLRTRDERELSYLVGEPLIAAVVAGGRVLASA